MKGRWISLPTLNSTVRLSQSTILCPMRLKFSWIILTTMASNRTRIFTGSKTIQWSRFHQSMNSIRRKIGSPNNLFAIHRTQMTTTRTQIEHWSGICRLVVIFKAGLSILWERIRSESSTITSMIRSWLNQQQLLFQAIQRLKNCETQWTPHRWKGYSCETILATLIHQSNATVFTSTTKTRVCIILCLS